MPQPLESSVIRILRPSGKPEGAGFLIAPNLAVTCAHVVKNTLGWKEYPLEAPDVEIKLDFPLAAARQVITAKIVYLQPPQADGSGDIAALKLSEILPEGTQPVNIFYANDLWEHSFRAYGFPSGYDNGVWASGRILGHEASGLLQIEDVKQTGYFVQPGFSGGAVWDEELEGVVGMVVASDTSPGVRTAFILPVEALVKTLPELRKQVIPPCPYRGLFAFREQDAPYFFGREAFAEKLLTTVQSKSLVAVIGPSGCGKSSVVFAGLVPRLRPNPEWIIIDFRPTAHPFHALAATLLPLLEPQMSETERLVETRKLADALETGSLNLLEVFACIFKKYGPVCHLLVIADQFEELYTSCLDYTTKNKFVDALLDTCNTVQGLRLILTLRAGSLEQAMDYSPLVDALQYADLKLGPMNIAEFRSAIEKPAQARHVVFESGLVSRLLNDIGERSGNLPLLEFTLTLLWEHQSAGKLTHDAYENLGGVAGSLADYADHAYARFSKAEQNRVRYIFTQLVNLGTDMEDTRRIVNHFDLSEYDWTIVKRLADERLVVTNQNLANQETVEIVHEALIHKWPKLRSWLEEDRESLRIHYYLRESAREWDCFGRDRGDLYRGARLEQALEWVETHRIELAQLEREFLSDSQQFRAHELEDARKAAIEARKTADILRQRSIYLTIVLVISIIIACVAFLLWDEAKLATQNAESANTQIAKERDRAFTNYIASQALTQLDNQLDLALLLSGEAYQQFDTPQTRVSLSTTLAYNPKLIRLLFSNDYYVYDIAFNPSGQILASGDAEGIVNLWNVKTGQLINQLHTGHEEAVPTIAFSPNGEILASGSINNLIQLWDIKTGQVIGHPLIGHNDWIKSVVFSPDGKFLASGSMDNTIRLWDMENGEPNIKYIINQTGTISSNVTFSPDGNYLAWGSEDNAIHLWDMNTHILIDKPFIGHTDPVLCVTFSPNGKLLASGGEDNTIFLWDVKSGMPTIQPITGHNEYVNSVAFSPDGETLASGSSDNTIRFWDTKAGYSLYEPLSIHTNGVGKVLFSPDGQTLASGSRDIIRLWNIKPNEDIIGFENWDPESKPLLSFLLGIKCFSTLLFEGGYFYSECVESEAVNPNILISQYSTGHSDYVHSLAISPDSELLASGSSDKTIRLRKIKTGQLIFRPLTGHTDTVNSLDFSPDGKYLASGSADRTIRLWDMETGQSISQPLIGHTASVLNVTFSSDGKILASGSADGTIRFWEKETGISIGQPLIGHTASVLDVAFSSDGKLLASVSEDHTILLWDLEKNKIINQSDLGEGIPQKIYFQNRNPITLVSDNNKIYLWDMKTRQTITQFPFDNFAEVTSVDLSLDSEIVASGNSYNEILLWDERSGQPVSPPLTSNENSVRLVLFSPDGKYLASVGDDDVIRIWDVDPSSWLERVCDRVGRNFTQYEWQQYFTGESYRLTCPQWPAGE